MRSKTILLGIGGSLLLALAVAGCNRQQKKEPPKAAATQQAAPAAATAAKTPSQTKTAGPQYPLTGTVAETFNSGGYTYLHLQAAGHDYWVAAPKTAVKKGDTVTVPSGMMMENFHSRTLNRTFPKIIFAASLGGQTNGTKVVSQNGAANGSFAQAVQKEGGQQAASETKKLVVGSTQAIVAAADVHVKKAPGKDGYRVGELFAQAAKLNGKEVEVRGKVTKVSPNIMGRNWIHIQDGTGNPKTATHELVVTSKSAAPKTGEVVTLKGVLHANKDFGAGYKYAAIVEDAKIVKP